MVMDGREWIDLQRTFFDFKAEASKHDFYTQDIERMEKSIWEMSPFKKIMTKERV